MKPESSQAIADGLAVPWSWCSVCQRAYVSGTCRIVRFPPDALHAHPPVLKMCPYVGCSGSISRNGWLWSSVRLQHPEYPFTPQPNVVYTRSV